jgi:hypothetical protein
MMWNPVIVINPKSNSKESAYTYAKSLGYIAGQTFLATTHEQADRIATRYGWKNILTCPKITKEKNVKNR